MAKLPSDIGHFAALRERVARIVAANPHLKAQINGEPKPHVDPKETIIHIDLKTGERTIEEYVRRAIDISLASPDTKRYISGALERSIQQAIEESEQKRVWRNKQIRMMTAGQDLTEVDVILDACSEVTGIPVAEMRGDRRQRAVAWPRFLACGMIVWVRPDLSYPSIGRILGGRDHTTIMHGVKQFKLMQHLPPFDAWLADPRIKALFEKPELQAAE